MTEPIKLPPLPEGYTLTKPWDYEGQMFTEGQMKAYAIAAIEAALQSQAQGEVMEMALCESRRLILRIGQAYRFVPMEGCKTCEEMKAEHDQAYVIDHARRIEGDGE